MDLLDVILQEIEPHLRDVQPIAFIGAVIVEDDKGNIRTSIIHIEDDANPMYEGDRLKFINALREMITTLEEG